MNKQQRDEAIFRAGNHLSAALGELKAAQAALKAAGVSETRPSRLMNTFFAVALLRDLLKEELHRHLYGISRVLGDFDPEVTPPVQESGRHANARRGPDEWPAGAS